MASKTRINQIKAELQKQGYTPSDEAVNAVLDILASDSSLNVSTATFQYCQTAEKVEHNGTKLSGNSNNVKNALKKSLKQKLVSQAWSELVQELQAGDFSDVELDAIDVNFDEVFDNPKFFSSSVALPPSSEQKLLPTTEEIFNAEVLPQ